MNDAGGLLDEIMSIPGVDCAALFATVDRSGDLKLLAHDGLSPAFVRDSEQVCATPLSDANIRDGRVCMRDFVTLMREMDNGTILMEGIRAILVVPIRRKMRVMGTLHVASRRFSVFEPATVAAVEAAADRLEFAIEHDVV